MHFFFSFSGVGAQAVRVGLECHSSRSVYARCCSRINAPKSVQIRQQLTAAPMILGSIDRYVGPLKEEDMLYHISELGLVVSFPFLWRGFLRDGVFGDVLRLRDVFIWTSVGIFFTVL